MEKVILAYLRRRAFLRALVDNTENLDTKNPDVRQVDIALISDLTFHKVMIQLSNIN